MSVTTGPTVGRAGRPEKRRAIVRGARRVFALEGYSRASIERIAADAEVSTRTIYNHFSDKAELFTTVIEDSATAVAEAQEGLIREYLDPVVESGDLDGLVRFGRRWAASAQDAEEHFALMGHVSAEAHFIPPEAIRVWQQAGPSRVEQEMSTRFARLAELGLIHAPDPHRAAAHFMLLVGSAVAQDSLNGAVPLPKAEVDQIADAGVEAFLRAYRAED
ncbi:TetR/AcrR family transcriptional regulator [Ornithinimicrobium sufpigmenti]|uniref:TetR/AcrR family transcriptional regulator n=1 Tax=Ornithinimicrobium sufpigmenti TaxID=2508882 RepID=UPI00192D7342|nr:TetR/AcrR family transcriptional regulator [Ornithinimicrobium sp. HY008]